MESLGSGRLEILARQAGDAGHRGRGRDAAHPGQPLMFAALRNEWAQGIG